MVVKSRRRREDGLWWWKKDEYMRGRVPRHEQYEISSVRTFYLQNLMGLMVFGFKIQGLLQFERKEFSLSLSLLSVCLLSLFVSVLCVKWRKGVFIYTLFSFSANEFSFFSIVVTRRQRWNSSFLILSRSIELDKDWEGVEVEHGKSLCCSCNWYEKIVILKF